MLTRKPVKGDVVRWPNWPQGRVAIVQSVDGNLCWIREGADESMPFIWRSQGVLNHLAEFVESTAAPEAGR